MKVSGSGGLGSTAAPRAGGRASAPGFALPGGSGPAEAATATGMANVSGVGSIDALLALQEVGGPLERRRRSVRRAGVILDVLDEIKLALLDQGVPPPALRRLVEAIQHQRETTDDPTLEGLLDEIETRAAVELAKLEMTAVHA